MAHDLADILATELEPGLTPLMRKVGFEPVSPAQLSPTDNYFFHERDQRLLSPKGDWRNPEDVLRYRNNHGLPVQIRRGARDPYTLTTFRPRIFALTFRYDLETHQEFQYDEAIRLIPPTEQLSGLSINFRQALETDYVALRRAELERDPRYHIPVEFTTPDYSGFAKDYPGMPQDVKPGQLLFNLWLEYGDSLAPLEGHAKTEALSKIPCIITVTVNIVQLFAMAQINAYMAQMQSNRRLAEALQSAAVLPARG